MPADNLEPEFFELEITRFEPTPATTEHRIKTVDALDRLLGNFESESELVIGLTAVDPDDCDMGSFWLFLKGERSWAHLTEGACYEARDPAFSGPSQATLEFQDDSGNQHRVPVRHTLSRDQGLKALRHWLPHGERLSELIWSQV